MISDRHFLGAPDGVNRVVQGPLLAPPPPLGRADVAEIIVIDSDSAAEEPQPGQAGKRGREEGKRGRARVQAMPTTTGKKAEAKPKSPSKPKASKPKAEKTAKGKGKRMLWKT